MGRGSRLKNTSIYALTVFLTGAVGAHAQTPNSSVTGSIGLTTRIDVDSNKNLAPVSPGTTTEVAEILSFSVRTETNTQFLELRADTSLKYTDTPRSGSDLSFADPTVDLQYFREGANSDLDLNATYWNGDVVSSFDSDPTAAVSIVSDTGTLTRLDFTSTLRTGIGGPLQFIFDTNYSSRDYSGTSDPNLFDSDTVGLGLSANLRFSPVTSGNVGIKRTDFSAKDAASTETETTLYTFGVAHEIRSGLTLNANLGFQDRVNITSGGSNSRKGASGSFDLTQMRPNGSISVAMSFDNSGPTNTRSLSFGRSLDLPRGTLSTSISATDISGRGVQLFGNAAYNLQLATSTLNVSLDRNLTTNAIDQDIQFTQLGVGYQQQINNASTIDLKLNLNKAEDGGAGSYPTQERATLSAAYSQAVTSDWNLSVGYSHDRYSTATAADANSNSVFLALSRSIQFGF